MDLFSMRVTYRKTLALECPEGCLALREYIGMYGENYPCC